MLGTEKKNGRMEYWNNGILEGWNGETKWKNGRLGTEKQKGMMEYWNDGNGRQVKGNVGILE